MRCPDTQKLLEYEAEKIVERGCYQKAYRVIGRGERLVAQHDFR
jgi:hypothetical protein